MRERIKSTSQDDLILIDDSAEVNDRENSASRLIFDGFFDMLRPILDKWLDHSEFLLRSRAITFFLGRLGDINYFEKGIEMLHNDMNWSVRSNCAYALKVFAKDFAEGENFKSRIIKELLISLLNDNDEAVQAKSYQGLHEIIKDKSWDNFSNTDFFDHTRDVDWDMLNPYLEKYNLQKPVEN